MTYGVCSIALVHYIFRDLTNMRATWAISTARPRPTSGRTGPASWFMVNRYVMLYYILYHDAGGGAISGARPRPTSDNERERVV